MNDLKKYRNAILILFVLLIIFFFLLFAEIKTLVSSDEIEKPGFLLYLTLIGVFVMGMGLVLVNFQLLIRAGKRKGIQNEELDKALNKQDTTTEEAAKKEQKGKKEEKNKLDAAKYAQKLIPSVQPDDTFQRFSEKMLGNFAKEFNIVQGLFFTRNEQDEFSMEGQYAYYSEEQPRSFVEGDTLPGQVAKNQKILKVPNIPEGYITILSGLGKSSPKVLVIIPVVIKEKTQAIIELASFSDFDDTHIHLFEDLSSIIAEKISKLIKKS